MNGRDMAVRIVPLTSDEASDARMGGTVDARGARGPGEADTRHEVRRLRPST